MALEIPNLDDRRFQDLVDEAKHRLALHCPEWSDHNVSDPGVMLIELFAHMVDQLTFRLNQVPDRLYLQMLELVGVKRYPPSAASADITFWLSAPATRELVVPAGAQVATPRHADAPQVTFTVPDELRIVPCGFARAGSGLIDGEINWREGSIHEDAPLVCFADPPQVGEAFYIRLDAAVPACVVRLRFRCDPAYGQGVDPDHAPLAWAVEAPGEWLPCECSLDTTGGLNQDGEMLLHLPGELPGGPTVLRCAVVEEDVPRYRLSPRIEGIGADSVGGTAVGLHADIVRNELLGVSNGLPGQRLRLAHPPLAWPAGSRTGAVIVEVDDHGEVEEWTRVDDFAESGEEDRHFTLDAAAGEVSFGPAVNHRPHHRHGGAGATQRLERTLDLHGAVPPRGANIVVRRYTTGGGELGNVAAGQLTVLKTSLPFVRAVENRRVASGGTSSETIDQVKARGPIELRTLERAVTPEDYEQFALRDSRVARVRCYAARIEPDDPPVARVLIVPRVATGLGRSLELDDLEPSPELMEAIRQELEPRRVIGARFEVAAPSYVGLRVDARVRLKAGFEPGVVELAGERALGDYFHPTIGGPDGRGWPFGRAVFSGMAYLVLQRVPGVELVEDVRLIPVDMRNGRRGEHTQGFRLGPDALIVSRAHQVAAAGEPQ